MVVLKATVLTRRLSLSLFIALLALSAGCASMRNTPQQDYVFEMGRTCQNTGITEVSVDRVEPDGKRYWMRAGVGMWEHEVPKFRECMQEQFKLHPYSEWLRKQSASSQPATVTPPSTGSLTPSSGATTTPQPAAKTSATAAVPSASSMQPPTWAIGDEWSYRWQSPRGNGTFVWAVDRMETVEGIDSAVVRSGNREIFFRRGDGAIHLEKVEGAVELRYRPAFNMISWPLEAGKRWTAAYTREQPIARQTEDMLVDCRVDSEETVTVPAGTFRTFHVICLNQRSGSLNFEFWYAPEVGNVVKERTRFSYGIRERELLGFKRTERR